MMANSKSMVSAAFLRKSAEFLEPVKQYAQNLIQQSKPKRILDIGCGPGIDTIQLALKLGKDCQVCGIDHDAQMIEQAKHWAFANNVTVVHQQSDVTQIPYHAEHFDVVRSERLFQHLSIIDKRDQTMAESLRVLKKSGLMVFADSDWASASIDFPDVVLERKLLNFFTDTLIPNGYAGRQLPGLFKSFALQDIEVKIIPIYFHELQFTPYGDFLANAALKAQIITKGDATFWLNTLKNLDQQGRFYCTINLVVVSGVK